MLQNQVVLQKGNTIKVFQTNGWLRTIYAHACDRLRYVGKDATKIIDKHLVAGWTKTNG